MKIHFFMNMIPPTKTYQEHRVGRTKTGKVYVYEDRELKAIRAEYRSRLLKAAPKEPLKGAIRLVVKWLFPRGKHPDGEYKTTKPDTDNLLKMLKDEMTKAGFWKDDSQVASEVVEKFWSEISGIYVEIETLEREGQ
jgi:Holliday junction resolvase RusA-like endonuclease